MTVIKHIIFKRIIFQKDNFAIFATEENETFKGNILHSPQDLINVSLEVQAEEVIHPKYGKQYNIINYSIKENPLYFFLKNITKSGVPSETLKEISSKYTIDDFEKIIEKNPEKLLNIKNIGEKRLQTIIDSFNKNKHLIQISKIFYEFDFSSNLINLIFKAIKNKTVTAEEILENPYSLIKINGIGFKKADDIAINKIHINPESPMRFESFVKAELNNLIYSQNHTVIENEIVFNEAKEYFSEIENIEEKIDTAIKSLLNRKEIEKIENYLTLPNVKQMEEYIKNFLQNYDNYRFWKIDEKKEELFKFMITNTSYSLSDKQQKAFLNFSTTDAPFFVLAGYAGSGKTTVSKLIMDFYAQKFGKDAIVACALSGNASNRIKTVTGYQAFTIHSLLGWNGKYFEYNEENKLPFKLIVLDEASMVDLFLFYSLFKAIDFTKTKLFIIGDNAQLPPVGLGEVFNDILQNYEVEKIILDKVFRQSEKQVINIFAQEIRKGKVPKGYKNKYEDFEFIVIEEKDYFKKIREFTDDEKQELRTNINQKIYEQINSLLDEYNESILSFLQDAIIEKTIYQDIIKLQEYSQRYISMLQIIAPQKKGITGTKELNKLAKSIINPDMSPFKNGINVFDKVIHLENKNKYVVSLEDYFIFKQGVNSVSKEDAELILEKIIDGEEEIKEMLNTQFTRVFNGQTGIVLDTFIYEENKFLSVYYPLENYVTFYGDYEINQEILDLSYAFTIHKSQGSEYLNVIIPVSLSDSYMLNNKLLYTAVTRAKKKLYLIGETYAFSIGVKKKDETVRKTLLKLNAYSK